MDADDPVSNRVESSKFGWDRDRLTKELCEVQTTLLGLGIAIILALVAALVGPHFVVWSDYRATFEQHAAKAIGAPVSIAGRIDARLLPVPLSDAA